MFLVIVSFDLIFLKSISHYSIKVLKRFMAHYFVISHLVVYPSETIKLIERIYKALL